MHCHLVDRILQVFCDYATIRIVPTIGKIVEQSGPVAKTPEFHGPRSKKRNLIMAFEMSDSQQSILSVEFLDKKGNPAAVDGVPQWSTDNSDVLALTPETNGLSCLVQAVGPLGVGNITLKADADLGAGVVELIGTVQVTITGGAATVVQIANSTPEEQP